MSNLPATLPFNGEIEFVEHNGEFVLTTEQIATGLGYKDVTGIRKICKRHEDELKSYKGGVTLSTPGGPQSGTVYTEEGIYLICNTRDQRAMGDVRRGLSLF